jgi:hypothetical protein
MVQVNNFENLSQLRDLMDSPHQNFSHPFAEMKLTEMQNLSSAPNTSRDHLPGLQIIPDKGDSTPAKTQTLESRTSTFAPSMGQRIPFVTEISPEFIKSVKEQFSSMLKSITGEANDAPILRKPLPEVSPEKPQFRENANQSDAREPMLKTVIKPNGNNAYKEVNTLGETGDVVSTVDVYLDPKTQSITRATRMADGKLFSLETENKDKSREVITFDEQERKISTQLLLPNGGYEMRDANDKIVFSNIQTVVGEPVQKLRK